MKKGSKILLLICAFAFCTVMGIFIGRNLRDDYVSIPASNIEVQTEEKTDLTDPRIDINSATKQQLSQLPGIGEVLAQRIVDYRTKIGGFRSVEELMEVEGIGEGKFERVKDLIRIGG